jgi:redox-sensitive bicupin YhaK (pirin superfamily)
VGDAGDGIATFRHSVWVALPRQDEESDPAFAHHGAGELPVIEGEGKRVRLIAGSLYGAQSPVQALSEMFYADIALVERARLPMRKWREFRIVSQLRKWWVGRKTGRAVRPL